MVKNWAIAIGINQYDLLQPLNYAKRDAQLMQQFLSNEAGFEKVFFFSDDSPDVGGESTRPTRTNLLRILRQLFENSFMGAGDNFWFFFSGHGIRYANRDYLMPCDGDPEDIENTAIPINHVTERLRRCGADNVVLILDACRNQSQKSGEGIGRQTAEEARQQGVISIFSCSPQEYSYEIQALQQGAFTTALLEGLGIQGQCATVERLNQYLNFRVPEIVRQYINQRQTPYIIAEPVNKSHLILVPKYATLADIATLKNDAYRAQGKRDFDLAKQLWIRVLAAASGQDMEAIEALEDIARLRNSATNPYVAQPPQQPIPSKSATNSPVSPPPNTNAQASTPISPLPNWTRRKVIQIFGFTGAGLGLAILVPRFWQSNSGESRTNETNTIKPVTTAHPPFRTFSDSLKTFKFTTAKVDPQGNIIDRPKGEAKYLVEDLGNGVTIEMVQIPGGTFRMGSPAGEVGRSAYEIPQHQVTVPGFFMGRYAVTQAQYQAIMGANPSYFQGEKRPVESVSWNDAVEFCNKLSQKTGRKYRLPSEAEWEYACRARTTTPFYFGETITTDLANYRGTDWTIGNTTYPGNYGNGSKGEYREQTTPVGTFPPNAFGLHDMHGNVWEWCQDHWHNNYNGAPTDGSAWVNNNDNQYRLLHGGSWNDGPVDCRCANRIGNSVGLRSGIIGFRAVLVSA